MNTKNQLLVEPKKISSQIGITKIEHSYNPMFKILNKIYIIFVTKYL